MIIHPTIRNFRLFTYLTLVLVHLLSSVKAQVIRDDQQCQNNGNYTNSSTYQTNLNALLTNLSVNIDNTGFYTSSVGQSPNRVNVIALCRGDSKHNECTSCVQGIATEIVELCPNNRQAMMWYDTCMLRFSDASIFGVMETQPYTVKGNIENTSNPDALMSDLGTLLDGVRDQAAYGNSSMKIATGNRNTRGNQTIFTLVQCTPDLSQRGCDICLRSATSRLPTSYSYGRIGGRIRLPSCNIRYETVSFYNETRVQEVLSQTMLVPSPQQRLGT